MVNRVEAEVVREKVRALIERVKGDQAFAELWRNDRKARWISMKKQLEISFAKSIRELR